MDEDAWLDRFGLRPVGRDLDQVRKTLNSHTDRERREQGAGDVLLMRLCCIQLFNAGELPDTLSIWKAKTASFDSHCSIDVQLLCGQGLVDTKAYLSSEGSTDAGKALTYLFKCEEAGDFDGFSVEDYSAWWQTWYAC